MNPTDQTGEIKKKARDLGFDLVGVCPAVSPTGVAHFREWLEAGRHGQMHYLADRRDAYSHPRFVLDGVRSIVMLGTHYRTVEPAASGTGFGRVSRYAWGDSDYHDLIHSRLKQLKRFVTELLPDAEAGSPMVRGVVDTAPLLEREFAQLAGLGWQGKNTMLISPTAGSYFFLSCLLLNAFLDYDQPHLTDHCGSCTACLDACPTDAFPEPRVLDATRCISYLTIELRDEVPEELREPIGDWVFGCDVCQEVCPWNRFAPITDESAFEPLPQNDPLDLHALFHLNDDAFRARFRKTPLWRPRRRGLLRNAAIVLGNQHSTDALPALARALKDSEPLVRSTAAWAIGQIGIHSTGKDACERLLLERVSSETDADTKTEIEQALLLLNK